MDKETKYDGWSFFFFPSDQSKHNAYKKFNKALLVIGIIITFPISIPVILIHKHKVKKEK